MNRSCCSDNGAPKFERRARTQTGKRYALARDTHDTTFVTKQLVSQPEFVASDGTRRITSDYLAFSHSKNIAVLTWTVNDPADMTSLIKLGIDGIYTRRPDVMVKLLEDMGLR